jgi:hypothetical protein
MRIKHRRRAARGSIAVGAAIGTLCLLAVGQTPAHAAVTQGVPAPYVTTANGSDPHTKPCTHNGLQGICLFTSQDLQQGEVTTGYPSGAQNRYPMSQTLGYFSTDGINWSAPTVLMRENTYQNQGWVQSTFNGLAYSPLHLWAPSAQQGPDGNWYLYVPDISDSLHPATSSFVGVSRASDPMGPYTPIGKVSISDYASDPDVVDSMSGRFGTGPYLAWADGDFSNCGGISIAPLGNDMTTLNAAPTRPLFDGVPSTFTSTAPGGGPCTDRFGRTHFYMEGPHIYNTTLGGAAGNWPAGTPGPYLMTVPIKPGATPPECALVPQGQPNTPNELIAYFTAGSPLGDLSAADGQYHWNYGGILMCGSANEFTDQGSIVPVTTSARTGGHTPLIFVYHDGPGPSSTTGHHRTIHAECLLYDAADLHGGTNGTFTSPGNIAGSIRTAGTQFTDSGAEANCLTSFDSTSVALRTPGGILSSDNAPAMFMSGNGALFANRFGVGPWEKFRMKQGATTLPATFADFGSTRTNGVSILAEANNRFVSVAGLGSCLNANATTVGPNQLFDFIPRYFGGNFGGTDFHSEPTNNGEISLSTTSQVCDNGDGAFPWLVYHY